MANPKIRTWVHLYERLMRQDLKSLSDQRIFFKDENNEIVPLHLVYDKNGASFWFEQIDKDFNLFEEIKESLNDAIELERNKNETKNS